MKEDDADDEEDQRRNDDDDYDTLHPSQWEELKSDPMNSIQQR